MSDRERRARLEQLQAGLKAMEAELAAPPSAEHVAALDERREAADVAEERARLMEREVSLQSAAAVALGARVEREEQAELGPQAQRDVPAVAILVTFAAGLAGLCAAIFVLTLPRTPELTLLVKAFALVAMVPAAWVVKRRL